MFAHTILIIITLLPLIILSGVILLHVWCVNEGLVVSTLSRTLKETAFFRFF